MRTLTRPNTVQRAVRTQRCVAEVASIGRRAVWVEGGEVRAGCWWGLGGASSREPAPSLASSFQLVSARRVVPLLSSRANARTRTPSSTHTPPIATPADMELEPGFEPQLRARSNTWPLPRPEATDEAAAEAANAAAAAAGNVAAGGQNFGQQGKMFAPPPTGVDALGHVLGAAKKNSSRRNAWGNMSYADLITQAIQSAPENRLTLSQIYDWMVQNVPYFKDKGDSNSSAGWKVGCFFFLVKGARACGRATETCWRTGAT